VAAEKSKGIKNLRKESKTSRHEKSKDHLQTDRCVYDEGKTNR
jgi:hypothetical protein